MESVSVDPGGVTTSLLVSDEDCFARLAHDYGMQYPTEIKQRLVCGAELELDAVLRLDPIGWPNFGCEPDAKMQMASRVGLINL